MLNCGNGHGVYVIVKAVDTDGNLIGSSSGMTLNQVCEMVEDMQIGECPVCGTGRMPLTKSTKQ